MANPHFVLLAPRRQSRRGPRPSAPSRIRLSIAVIPRSLFFVAAVLLTLLPIFALGNPQSIEQRIEAEREKAAKIQSALHSKRAQLNVVTARYNDLSAQLHETNVAIADVNDRIGGLDAQ